VASVGERLPLPIYCVIMVDRSTLFAMGFMQLAADNDRKSNCTNHEQSTGVFRCRRIVLFK
jgi:hypothetical protein